jgi:protoporphyrinogen oxidase
MIERHPQSLSQADRVMILGAGPCGLGSASELQDAGLDSWTLYDSAHKAGGLASTLTSKEGFLFDIGGHVIFSHYKKFDEMCDRVCDEWIDHERNAWIFMKNRFIPYPLQRNFGHLPPDDVEMCLEGLKKILATSFPKPRNFEEWLRQSFGQGLYNIFMEPYNFKVWAFPPRELNSVWVGERVAHIDPQMIDKIAKGETTKEWGPNANFRYPKYGGTGSIWLGLASELSNDKLNFNARITDVNAESRTVTLSDGSSGNYDFLISTIPLDQLIQMVHNTGFPNLDKLSKLFKHSSTHIIGIGMNGQCPKQLEGKSWIYFPEENVPFYRATVLSNYSPFTVPEPGKQWSLLLETSESSKKPVNSKHILGQAIAACKELSFIPKDTEIVSRLHKRFEYAYPTPFLERDGVSRFAFDVLEKNNIFSRGRFGAWKYEVSNQDHTYMQGVEVARRLLFDEEEVTFLHPEVVNRQSGR